MITNNQDVSIDACRVLPEKLSCAPIPLNFSTTEEVEPLESHVFIGQPRAEEAFEKGLATPGHIFVVGLDSISTALLEHIKKEAGEIMRDTRISDFVCVYNFEHPSKPGFIELEKGQALRFERDTEKFLQELKDKIPERLECDDFRKKVNKIQEEASRQIRDAWDRFTRETNEIAIKTEKIGSIGFVAISSQAGVNLFPIVLADPQKKPLTSDEYKNLEESERKEIDEISRQILERINEHMRNAQNFQLKAEEEVAMLKRESIDALFVEKTEKIRLYYGDAILSFIDGLREYTLAHIKSFLPQDNNGSFPAAFQSHSDPFLPFKINVFVDNAKTEGIPVIDHRNIDYGRLFGEISYTIGPGGVPLGGHTNIRAGLLSEANHGILVLSARDVFFKGVWDKLKAVLETKRLDIGHSNPFANLIPETLHVDVKLVLVGEWDIYRAFNSPGMKQQFDEIFKTVAMFDSQVYRSDEVIQQFAGLIRLFCDRDSLPPVSCEGVAEFLKYLSRLEQDQNRFSLDVRSLKDILNEAAWLARADAKGRTQDDALITAGNVNQAIYDKIYRLDLVREKIYEHIKNGIILLSFDGEEVGQINALSVYDFGDFRFGTPSRITAKTFSGKDGVISIDRAVALAERSHNKGVLILGGYLGWKFAQDRPLSLSATLAFEQSYGGVEGDSASSAELYAILSSLSMMPLRQDIAVTGSVNQTGEIQPIGGVNEKVEGFFDVCSLLGLSGSQRVIIPQQNVRNLMLREDVVEAVKERKFHVYAVRTIDEGMEILTGKKMGERIADGPYRGGYPVSSINWGVESGLRKLAKASGEGDKKH